MDEIRAELDDRERALNLNVRKQGLSTGTGIALAAVILVAGYWGGKFINDEIEYRRIENALTKIGQAFGIVSPAPMQNVQAKPQQKAEPKIQIRYKDPTATESNWRPQTSQANNTRTAQIQQERLRQLETDLKKEQQRNQALKRQAEYTKDLKRIEARKKAEHEAWNSVGCRFWWERNGWPAYKARELTACKP